MRRLATYALVLALPVAAHAQDDDRTFLEGLLEDNLSGAGREVRVEGFTGALSSEATIERLTIADDQGIWLTLEGVTLDWNRGALLRGRFDVNRLTAETIDLPRLPAAPETTELPDPEAPGFSLPELPVAVNIGEISSPSIAIGAPVFGVDATFSLEGAIALAGGEGTATLDIVRTDGAVGQLALDAGYANETRILNLDLLLDEQPGGIAARLAGLPGDPAVRLALEGTGPLDEFSATLTLATDGQERLAGNVVVGGTDGDGATDPAAPVPFRAEFGGDVAPLFAPEYRDFFGPDMRLALTGARAADGSTDVDRLALSARALDLEGRLSLLPGGAPASFDLTGTIVGADGAPVRLPLPGDPTDVGRVTLRLGFDSAVSEDWSGTFGIEDLDRPGFSAEAIDIDGRGRISTRPEGTAFTAAFDFAATALDLGDPGAAQAVGERVSGRVDLSGNPGQPLEVTELTVDGENYSLAASGTFDIADRDLGVEVTATVAADDLSAFSGIAGRPLGGRVSATVRGSGSALAGDLDVAVDAVTRDVSVGVPEVDSILAGEGTVTLRAARDSDGIAVRTLRLGTPAAQVTGEGTLRSAGTSINLSGALQDLGILVPGLSGRHTLGVIANGDGAVWSLRSSVVGPSVTASVVGTVDDEAAVPSFDGVVALSATDIGPIGVRAGRAGLGGSVSARAEGRVDAALSTADMRLTVSGQNVATGMPEIDPLLVGSTEVTLEFARDRGPLEIRELTASTQTIRVEAAGTLTHLPEAILPAVGAALSATPAPAFEGRATISASDLSPAAGAASLPGLGGAVDVTVEGAVAADLSEFDLQFRTTGRSLTTGLPDIDPLLEGTTEIVLDAVRELGPLEIRRLAASTATIRVDAAGTVTNLPEAILPDVAGVMSATPAPAFAGRATISASDMSPASRISALPGLGGAVQATAEGRVAADLSDFDLRLDANGTDLRTGIAAADEYLRGGVILALDVGGSRDAVTIRRGRFASPALTASAEGTFGSSDADLSAEVALDNLGRVVEGFSGRASAQARLSRSGGGPWSLDATAAGPGGTTIDASGTVAGDFETADVAIRGSAPLGLANQFISPRSVGGDASFDLSLSGPLALRSLSGRITTSNARLVEPTLGLVAERIDGTVTLGQSRASLDIEARVQGGGRFRITGPVELAPPFDGALTIALRRVSLTDPDLYETRVNGEVNIQGPLTGGAEVSGRIDLETTEIRIPSGVTGGTAPIPDITHVGEPRRVYATRERAGLIETEEAAPPGRPFRLDIRIDAPNQIFLRGRGLDAELGGRLRVRGTTDNVAPEGQFSLLRGRLDILGKRLVLSEGSVTLQGALDPYVRLVATSQAEDVTVQVAVEGLASDPDIIFSSQPELPEDEVVSRLLFGRGIETLSPFQAAQMAASVATLTGGGNGVLGSLRENFGLDNFDVSTTEQGSTSFTFGKYLTDNIYTDLAVGPEGETEIEINLDLTPSVKVIGHASDSGETGIGIYYERDY